ncbi:MAG: hypothetical protein JST22_05000 [Bacteroidetes bacterium]|nr:hypothetical protein [Bacteroidota bacterium]
MSWILLLSGSAAEAANIQLLQRMHGPARLLVRRPGLYIAAGGIPETCIICNDVERLSGWIVVGAGWRLLDDGCRMIRASDWHTYIHRAPDSLANLDGHWAIVRWNAETAECFTDGLGLRELYFGAIDSSICVATRPDWVARSRGGADADFASLEGRWLLFNQIGYGSGVSGVHRCGPGGRLSVRAGRVAGHTSTPWQPHFRGRGTEHALMRAADSLRAVCDERPGDVSLGLSGGIDSRLLLALMLENGAHTFVAHTFGEAADPDVDIAGQLAHAAGVEWSRIRTGNGDPQAMLARAREYVVQTALVEPASSAIRLGLYSSLRRAGRVLVDGGFGELVRHRYYRRIALAGRDALLRRDARRLLPYLRSQRAAIFLPDVAATLERGALDNLQAVLDALPDIGRIGVENALNLLAVRTRIPNYGAPEQARLDAIVPNLMPCAQPSLLQELFAPWMPSAIRSNRAVREVIRHAARRHVIPDLARLPLVAGGVLYSLGEPAFTVRLRAVAGRMLRRRHQATVTASHRDIFLQQLREYMFDLVHSESVAGYGAYNVAAIRNAVTAYYHGGRHLAAYVDWWLTFELWRGGGDIEI